MATACFVCVGGGGMEGEKSGRGGGRNDCVGVDVYLMKREGEEKAYARVCVRVFV